MSPKQVSPEIAKRREETKIYRAYFKRFGILTTVITGRNVALMKKPLKSGKDELRVERRKQARRLASLPQRLAAMRRRTIAHFNTHAADEERRLTLLVKKRGLYEGACDLPWAEYFKFREMNNCEALTPDDIRYLSQWTRCPV
jgi:hypothetical protein